MIAVYERVAVPQVYLAGFVSLIVWPTGVVGTPVAAGTGVVMTCGHPLAVNPCTRRC